jgi:acetate kinase
MILTLNAGSSSLKFALFPAACGSVAVAAGVVEMAPEGRHLSVRDAEGAETDAARWDGADTPFHADALARLVAWQRRRFPGVEIAAVGHRVVHGGAARSAPVRVDDAVLAELAAFNPLAPLHQPHNLAGIAAARAAWPGVPQVACFDTGFHRGHPFVNDTFALPRRLYDEGVRRYGFHGLSYEYVTARLAAIAPDLAQGRVVIAHLGNGASACAVRGGRAVASSMGFTALDGLPMGTRCGQLDPGVVLYLIGEKGMSVGEVTDLLYKESGLKGLSGLSHDMRTLLEAGTEAAGQAIDYFVVRLRREIGALAAAIDGLDALVFCGGIGEHAWQIRARTLAPMAWLGIALDEAANRAPAEAERVISAPHAPVTVLVIPTNEEAMIAAHTRAVAGLG